jgi:hypothetical protein
LSAIVASTRSCHMVMAGTTAVHSSDHPRADAYQLPGSRTIEMMRPSG